MSETLSKSNFEVIDSIANNQKAYILSDELRNKAQQIIETLDFPTTRTEAWKYTRVGKIKNTRFKIQDYKTQDSRLQDLRLKIQDSRLKIQDFLVPELKGSVLVFINGFYHAELSKIEEESGLEISSLTEANDFSQKFLGKLVPLENEIFNSFNTFYAQDGVFMRVHKKTEVKQSIQVLFLTSGENVYSGNRNLIVCEDFSSTHIVLNYASLGANSCFNNSITEIHVGVNAHLKIDKIQQEDSSNFNIIGEYVNQEKDSTFTINTLTLDGGLVRNNLSIAVNGQNCETNLSGAYILKGKQHIDNHTVVDHKVPNCQSNELYKGVIDEQATGVFNGKVFVRKDAQKINAFQSNGNILLSDDALVNSKPELEIFADDVKCSHGSTTGQLDEEAIFYLRARGISEKSARALMVSAFIGDVIEKIENEAVQSYVHVKIEEKFGLT